ncbi:MAG TPA: M12 family metallopeptidase, partial [Planctomycetota bacterium]|nr:M12 family metallopeptidase [Planctomycetota bacterium]
MPNAVHQGARLARAARPIVSLLVVAALARAQEPAEIPDGWTLVDDLILPQWAVNGDANYSATPWPNGVVPYAFNANVTALNQTRAIDAMAEWEAVSAVTFVPRTTEANYITFNDSTGNSSFVGMIGGSQNVNMFNWSWRFIICHELAHALGFWHEQSRPDRDTYVTINWGNIDPAYSYNFFTQSSTTVGAYDFDSIMHYGQFAFSNNGLPTITVNPPNGAMQGTIGQRQHMSILDAGGVSFRYGPAPAPTITSISPTSAN